MTTTTRSWWEGDVYRTDTVRSVRTPDYSLLVQLGAVLPDNAFSHYGEWKGNGYVETNVLKWSGTLKKWQLTSETRTRIEAPGIGITPFPWGPADNKFLSKVKTASVSVITMMAERKATASLLTELSGNLLYTAVHWRKPRKVLARWFKTDKKVRKWATRKLERRILRCTSPAEAWLQYRFAARPLMGDIRDALEAFEKGDQKQHVTHISRKGSEDSICIQKNLGPDGTVTGRMFTRYDWKIVARFRVRDPSLAALGNLAGGLASIWDLLPWSFVIDWAWDISTWLDLQNATLGLEFVSGFKGLKSQYERTYSRSSVESVTTRYIPANECTFSWLSRYYVRSRLSSCPTPYLKRGSAAEIFGNGHVYDTLALARQILSGKAQNTYHFSN